MGQEIAADLLRERTIDRWLGSRINRDIQEALRRAFAEAVGDLLEECQASRSWRELSDEQRTLVRASAQPGDHRPALPHGGRPPGELPDEDVARLFTADHQTVNRELLAELERLGLIEGLPADFRRRSRERLLNGGHWPSAVHEEVIMTQGATLTIRLPEAVWQALNREARALEWPPDRVAVGLIWWGLQGRKAPFPGAEDWLEAERRAFFESPLGQYVLSHTNSDATLDQVLAITAKDQSSWSAEIIAEREERV